MTLQITNDQKEIFELSLRHYTRQEYVEVIDFTRTVENGVKGKDDVYMFTVPGQNVYLDSSGYAVTYDRQRIQNNKVYYKFTDDPNTPDDMAYEYIANYEWKEKNLPFQEEA